MIRPNFAKWDQNPEVIRRLSIEAEHPRSRERFQALYMIGTNETNATEWAENIERNARTVMDWVHNYNDLGPMGVHYQHTGGRHPLLTKMRKKK